VPLFGAVVDIVNLESPVTGYKVICQSKVWRVNCENKNAKSLLLLQRKRNYAEKNDGKGYCQSKDSH
jgi:hypothetical protein